MKFQIVNKETGDQIEIVKSREQGFARIEEYHSWLHSEGCYERPFILTDETGKEIKK